MRFHVKGDLHVHTKYSIEPGVFRGLLGATPFYGPRSVFEAAIERDMQVVTITDHDTMKGADLAEKIYKKNKRYRDSFIFTKGEEISTDKGHLLGIGMQEEIPKGTPVEEAIDSIKDQGGVSIAAHPFSVYGLGFELNRLKLDAIEVINPLAILSFMFIGNLRAKRMLKKLDVGAVAGSDAHVLSTYSRVFTRFSLKTATEDEVLKQIRTKKTVPDINFGPLSRFKELVKGFGLMVIPKKVKKCSNGY